MKIEKTPSINKHTSENTVLANVQELVDGDTIRVSIKGELTIVRLLGIDAPEMHHNQKAEDDAYTLDIPESILFDYGRQSLQGLQSFLQKGQRIVLTFDEEKKDRYGRLLAYVALDEGELLQVKMLEQGWVRPLPVRPNTRYSTQFQELYEKAFAQEKGIFKAGSPLRAWRVKQVYKKYHDS